MANFFVSVSPGVNRVLLGSTATYECNVDGSVDIQKYEWDGSPNIVFEERFDFGGNSKEILYVRDVKEYDNNTWVDCTVTSVDQRVVTDSARLVVLPLPDGLSKNGTMEGMNAGEIPKNGTMEGMNPGEIPKNGTMEGMNTGEIPKNETMEGMNAGEIPPLTAGGGVVIGLGFILVIIAMVGVIKWLKRLEMQTQTDLEKARNRYSRIEPSTSSQGGARYDRDQGNVQLGGYGPENDEDANDDSYEDMLPVVPTINIQGGSSRDSPRTAPRSGPGSGHGRYGPPPRR